MHNLKKRKKNDFKVAVTATTTHLLLGAVLIVASISTASLGAPIHLLKPAEAFIDPTTDNVVESPKSRTTESSKAPVVVSGNNIYVAWWTNNTANGNEEVMFRASTDGGATFINKTNLSNTTNADSWRVEIDGEGDNVVVSWWETNQTSDIPVARVSNDAGATFGPLLMLGANGTLGSGEAEGIAAIAEGE